MTVRCFLVLVVLVSLRAVFYWLHVSGRNHLGMERPARVQSDLMGICHHAAGISAPSFV